MRHWGRTSISSEVSSWWPQHRLTPAAASRERFQSLCLGFYCQVTAHLPSTAAWGSDGSCVTRSLQMMHETLNEQMLIFFNFRCVKDPGGERHWWWRSTTRFPGGDAGGAESNGRHRRRGCRHDDGLTSRRSDIVTPTADLSNKGPFTIQRCNCTPDLELSANWGPFQTWTDDMLEQTNPVVYWFMMVKTYQLWVIMALSHMKHDNLSPRSQWIFIQTGSSDSHFLSLYDPLCHIRIIWKWSSYSFFIEINPYPHIFCWFRGSCCEVLCFIHPPEGALC